MNAEKGNLPAAGKRFEMAGRVRHAVDLEESIGQKRDAGVRAQIAAS
jgi:hypothetical protein